MYLLNNRRKWFERRRPEGAAIPMSECVVTVETPVQYTGISVYPAVVVKYGDDVLVRDVDYALTYKDNVNLGNGTVTVTGIGAFTGRVVKTFSVVSSERPGPEWDFLVENATYVGKKMHSAAYQNQTTKLFGSFLANHEQDGRMVVGVANFLSSRYAAFYNIDPDENGEYHVANMGEARSVSPSAPSNNYPYPVAVSPDGSGVVWSSTQSNTWTVCQARLGEFADLTSVSSVDYSSQIPRSFIAHKICGCTFADRGMKFVAVGIGSGSDNIVFATFNLTSPYDASTIDVGNSSKAEFANTDSYNQPNGISVSSDGKTVIYTQGFSMIQLSLDVGFDFSSATKVSTKNLSYRGGYPYGLVVPPDVKSVFMATGDGYIHEYALNR